MEKLKDLKAQNQYRKALTKKGAQLEKLAEGDRKGEQISGSSMNLPLLDEQQIAEQVEAAGRVFTRFKSTLSRQQEVLLQKLIHQDSMQIDTAVKNDCEMVQTLYNLFFSWDNADSAQGDEVADENLTDEQKEEKEKQEKEEKRKREELERENALQKFEEQGGFSQVLKDIFNPSDMAAMELDSVFQLKNICKDFYRKK